MGEYADLFNGMAEEEALNHVLGYYEETRHESLFDRMFTRKHKLDRRTFIWTDKQGKRYFMDDITDSHLVNIIRYLKAGKGLVGSDVNRKELIKFLEEESDSVRHIKKES